jgi:hypothetical protein
MIAAAKYTFAVLDITDATKQGADAAENCQSHLSVVLSSGRK